MITRRVSIGRPPGLTPLPEPQAPEPVGIPLERWEHDGNSAPDGLSLMQRRPRDIYWLSDTSAAGTLWFVSS
jgi:hypothetical protein